MVDVDTLCLKKRPTFDLL